MDMNLLVALDALLSEGSVTGAAARLDLSVPAMSRTLNRIRRMVGDPILVRAGRGLVTTPRAEELRAGVHELVRQAHGLLNTGEGLDLAKLERVFTIRADDGMVSAFGPALLDMLGRHMPGVTIRFAPQGQQDVAALREGAIDLDIGVINDLGPEIVRQALVRDRFVAMFRAGHPLAASRRLGIRQFTSYGHVTVSRRGLLSGPVDHELAQRQMRRRIVAVASSFSEAMALARATDLIATLPEGITRGARHGLELRPLPVPTPPVIVSQAWHPRFNADPAHRALRQMMYRACHPDAQ
ncbi:MAG: Nodulation protein D 2 [Herbaspirillum frisingense]|uniref:Nodulation protein D 2 n=1 Tax=Herbaspirillum frisingense TaxID=92645 RepID=A0A7V8FZE7_9BURK|nr:MAG: Nodulation protein D 2 [Herbaspirillum frisingense]